VALHLEQDCGNQEKFGQLIDGHVKRFVTHHGNERIDQWSEWNVEHIHLVGADELEQQFHWAAEGRRRHDEGHAITLLDLTPA
jgi:hypothetical protein